MPDTAPTAWRPFWQLYPGAPPGAWSSPGFHVPTLVGQADTAGVPIMAPVAVSRMVMAADGSVPPGNENRIAEYASGPCNPLLTCSWPDGVVDGTVNGPTADVFHHPLSTEDGPDEPAPEAPAAIIALRTSAAVLMPAFGPEPPPYGPACAASGPAPPHSRIG